MQSCARSSFRRRLKHYSSLAALCAGLMLAGHAQAGVIVSGSNCGTGTIATTGTTTSQMIIGCAATGSLMVDSTGVLTTATAAYTAGSIGMVAGYFGTGIGTVTVNGNGTGGSATLNVAHSLQVGFSGGTGSLNVQNGGVVQVTTSGYEITLANSNSTASATVSGSGSTLTSGSDIYVAGFTGSTATLTVQNGGVVNTGSAGVNSGALNAATGGNTNATITVTGTGSTLNTHGLILGDGFDAGSNVSLTISNGGTVNVTTVAGAGSGVGIGASGTGTITVTGAGSTLNISPVTSGFIAGKEVVIGGYGNGTLLVGQSAAVNAAGANVIVSGGVLGTQTAYPGMVTVRNGAILTAASLTINPNGTLNGDGTVAANVILSGGTISPGNSPGTLTINGNLTTSSGAFNLELASASVRDHINVSGNVEIGKDTVFNLIFSYVPQAGDIFDIESFFSTAGLFTFDPGFDLSKDLTVTSLPGGNPIIVTAGSQRIVVGATAVPEPSSLLVFLAGLALISAVGAGRLRARRNS
jgi:T5SS/PEP-CTERM-associated repeat protein